VLEVLPNMVNYLIFVVIPLFIILICGSLAISPYSAFAAGKSPRDICTIDPTKKCECYNSPKNLAAFCCYKDQTGKENCESCDIDTNTGDYVNCMVERKPPTTGQANIPQGGGVLEQPPTPKKHGGTAFPKGGGVLEQPSTDQGTTQSPDNTLSQHHKSKGNDLLG
jgi:hypothetical protein